MASKRNAIGVLMGVELVLNGANINFVAFARYNPSFEIEGQVFALFVIVVRLFAVGEVVSLVLQPAIVLAIALFAPLLAAFSIWVGCQEYLVGTPGGRFQFVYKFVFFLDNFILWRKIFARIYSQTFLGQVENMPH